MSKRSLTVLVSCLLVLFVFGIGLGMAVPVLNPDTDYTFPHYAYSPLLEKFVDQLPGLTPAGTNDLGQYIPLAVADTNAYPGSAYYEVAEIDYKEQMHKNLPAVVGSKTAGTGGTVIRGYVQIEPPGATSTPPGSAHIALTYPNGSAIQFGGSQVYAYDNPHYLGPMIIATKGVPTRLKFYNLLPLGANGNLPVPVDTTLNGAGPGTKQIGTDPVTGVPIYEKYTQNRATVHLHGGDNPWVSDGTALQWITPAGELTAYTNGASFQNVPDMQVPPNGAATFYWPNAQSGRLMFYHDHAVGITRFVMTGVAAGYLLVDPAQETTLASLGVPGTITASPDLAHLIPLVIQDKTFVPDTNALAATDPLWLNSAKTWNGRTPPGLGNFWFPHVYVPNQDPTDLTGANPLGRWDYGPWFWPPWPVPAGSTPPTVSCTPESFMDTPIINGTAYPYVNVQPTKYRLQILNACNDRMINLQTYVAEPITVSVTNGGTLYSATPTVTIAAPAAGGTAAQATATVSFGVISAIVVTNAGAGYVIGERPVVSITDATGTGAGALASVLTDVAMVPAIPNPAIPFPASWLVQTPGMIPDILDMRQSGVPHPAARGPAMIQIATEGGVLPQPVIHYNVPIGFEQNKRNIVVLNVKEHTLFLAPAERADVVIDFSKFAGKTVILYNDSVAPVPAGDPRYDFYTGDLDFSATAGANNQGGAASTLPGFGPNTRTILQFRVAPGADSTAPVDDFDTNLVANLQNPATGLPHLFATVQEVPIVPEPDYDASYPARPATYARIADTALTFIPYGGTTAVTNQLLPKCIQELFDLLGRLNSTLGVELPFTTALIQTTIPLGFTDPTTEAFTNGETQIWKITHNGVDTHGVHFHLFNVQIIDRVGWDGAIRPPEPNEVGWKDTVRMNPLEDIIVAARAIAPAVPFGCPKSVRPLNPSIPLGSTFGFENVDPLTGNAPTNGAVSNVVANFEWEYTWHCHILGHEENDMMRPVVLNYPALVPQAPVVTARTNGGIALAWTDGTPVSSPSTMGNTRNEAGFRIIRSVGVGAYSTIGSSPANTTNFTDATATPLTVQYSYRVVAFNGAGAATSAAVSVGLALTPSAPTGLTATATAPGVSPIRVTLRWTDTANNETAYLIERKASTSTNIQTVRVGANVTNYVDGTVSGNRTYGYRVRCTNSSGASPYSNMATITTPSTSQPAAPSNVRILAVSTNFIRVGWNDNSNNELGFTVRRGDAVGGPWNVTVGVPANSTQYQNNNLPRQRTYYYQVRATNGFGNSSWVPATAISGRTL
jgi:FtsP/CotA-like multicopper oxidase with cupredoxin domain